MRPGCAQGTFHAVPGIRRVADREALAVGVVDRASGEVGLGGVAGVELALVVPRRRLQHFVQVRVFARGRRARIPRHLHADPLRQFLDRVEKLHAVVFHQELERGAVGPAAEAVIELLLRAHRERRRALVVEGTAGLVFAAGALERYPRLDQLDDVGAREQLVEEGIGDAAHGLKDAMPFPPRGMTCSF